MNNSTIRQAMDNLSAIFNYTTPTNEVPLHPLSEPEKNYIDNLIALLRQCHNIILSGAPGTGKTYLAKQIAKEMGAEYKFVQFHPSMDYTDFVEGIRPVSSDNPEPSAIGFKLLPGIFKSFCAMAVTPFHVEDNFDEIYDQFLEEFSDQDLVLETPVRKKRFHVRFSANESCIAVPETESKTEMSITRERLKEYMRTNTIHDWKPYVSAIGAFLSNKYDYKLEKSNTEKKDFVFIIDEINRGDLSKIFGELFFAIDPGYRGVAGKVETQYSNLLKSDDPFYDGFYVPENVYIIGTMNDIDRSVESMDFAIRRRFTWFTVRPNDRISMLEDSQYGLNEDVRLKAVTCMETINKIIRSAEGLGEAYEVGPAYFLKLKLLDNSFDKLWNFHIQPLLSEYLRGNPDAGDLLTQLQDGYFSALNSDKMSPDSNEVHG